MSVPDIAMPVPDMAMRVLPGTGTLAPSSPPSYAQCTPAQYRTAHRERVSAYAMGVPDMRGGAYAIVVRDIA
eukprot:2555133-Rhodomonas_salina.1